MMLSVVTVCNKIALNADVSKSTVTYCGCLGALKKKHPVEETAKMGNLLHFSR